MTTAQKKIKDDDQSRLATASAGDTTANQRVEQCAKCGDEPATENWGGTHDSLSLARNPRLIERWCRRCVLKAQVAHMRGLVPTLAKAEAELAALPTPRCKCPSYANAKGPYPSGFCPDCKKWYPGIDRAQAIALGHIQEGR